jgi:hypothetical protein
MRFTTLLVTTLLLAVPAGAIDLTGTWEGTFKCTEVDSGVKQKLTDRNELLAITQVGNVLSVDWVGVAPLAGFVIDDVKKPTEKGAAAIIDCETTTDLTTGYAELANLQANVKSAKGTGKIKGTSTYTRDGDTTGQCKWSFKRIDTADPVAAGCP